jgi:hypothetical protein
MGLRASMRKGHSQQRRADFVPMAKSVRQSLPKARWQVPARRQRVETLNLLHGLRRPSPKCVPLKQNVVRLETREACLSLPHT